jgi:hypothetical protein
MNRKHGLQLDFIRSLQPGQIEPFVHKQDWSVHQVISPLLDQYGPAEVRVMTFNFSEDSLRTLFLEERITRLQMLVDLTVNRNKLELMLFAASITPDIRIDSTHAKVLLVHNDRIDFGIVGSANLNLEVRYESGFWFTQGRFYDYFSDQFDRIYENAIPYE